MQSFEIVLWLGGIQGILLSLLLFLHKSNQPANKYLGSAIFFLSLELIYFVLHFTNNLLSFQYLIILFFFLPYIYVPFLDLYLLELTQRNLNVKKILLTFLPLFLNAVFVFIMFFLMQHSLPEFLTKLYLGDYGFAKILNNIKPLYGIGFVIYFVFKINVHNKKLKGSFSNLDKINLIWFRNLMIAMFVIGVILAAQHLFEVVYNEKSVFDYLIFIAIAVFIYLVGFMGLKQPQIFTQKVAEEFQEVEKYKKSGLTKEAADNFTNRLIKMMEEEKPFLNPNLTLYDLSKRLEISPHNLSEIINTNLKQNYYDFINSYRVEEFKSNLVKEDMKNFTILVVAFESGFKSKSAFNTVFKKFTGMTPTEYRNKIS